MKSFQKDQAFKLKDLLKQEGVKLPLQKVQHLLAKSYGYENSHVFFQKEKEFNQAFSLLFKNQNKKVKLTKIKDIPFYLDKINTSDGSLSFWWTNDVQSKPVHNLDTDPGNPFESNYLYHHLPSDIWIYKEDYDEILKTTRYQYTYFPNLDVFIKNSDSKLFKNDNDIKKYNNSKIDLQILKNKLNLVEKLEDIYRIISHPMIKKDMLLKILNSTKNWAIDLCIVFSDEDLYKYAQENSNWRIRTHFYVQKIMKLVKRKNMIDITNHPVNIKDEVYDNFYQEALLELKKNNDPKIKDILNLLKINIDMIKHPHHEHRKINRDFYIERNQEILKRRLLNYEN